MAEYMHLIGVEQMQSAANSMNRAAERMQQVASSFEYAAQRQQQLLDDWLVRFTDAIDRLKESSK